MAQIDNSTFIGNHLVKPTEEQIETMKRYDSALGNVQHAQHHNVPASAFAIPLVKVEPVPASSNANSLRVKLPFPVKVWAIDVGCEAAGGATGTVDVFADDGTTDASILDAAEDVKTTAGTSVRIAPEEGSEELAAGTEVYLKGASGAGGTLDGAQAVLWVERL